MGQLCSISGHAQVNQVNQSRLLVLNNGAWWARLTWTVNQLIE